MPDSSPIANPKPDLIPPAAVIDIARCTMGSIDVDLHSTSAVNTVVQAARFVERDDSSFCLEIHSFVSKRAFLAVPGAPAATVRRMANSLLRYYEQGIVSEAVLWFGNSEVLTHCPWLWDFPICIPFRRLSPMFWDDELEKPLRVSPSAWSPVIYMPPASPSDAFTRGLARFHAAASPYGRVVLDQWSGESNWQRCYQVLTGKPFFPSTDED